MVAVFREVGIAGSRVDRLHRVAADVVRVGAAAVHGDEAEREREIPNSGGNAAP
jgi:hypothetical protein